MIFNEAYNKESFSDFIRSFLPEDFVEKEQDLSHIQSCKVINRAVELGKSQSLGVHVLEMNHDKETDPRVAIATDAFRILATYQIDKALVIFNSKNSKNYRFSLLTISLDVDEKNKLTKSYSNARRFSFYLGPGAKVRTPEQQLVTKGRVKDLNDLVSRFSLEVVNKQFYLELAKHFDSLVDKEKNLLSLPFQTDPNIRKSFAMRLIGRIMFCWFLKQKHSPTDGPLVPDELLSTKAVENGYYHNILEPLFFGLLNTPIEGRDIRGELYDSVPYLNGGLFNPQHDDFYDLDREMLVSRYINTLVVSDEWFREFFKLLETYNFTIDENTVFDQELSVDPEMLGRIFENLLAEINPETGSSERKRTGSYYTPRQIVEYMVDRSLIEHLKTKTDISEDKLEALVSYDLSDDTKNPLTLSERKLVIDAIDSLRLLDPACGSGAFPIGALQKIVWILQRVDADCELWLEKKLAKVPELYRQKIRKDAETNPFDYTRKLDVIKNSIFGVDIQPIAVEIARLRCFLTLVVESEVNDTKPNRGVEPLPNLDFKFVCANTLVPAPEENSGGNQLFADDFDEKLSTAIDRYFSSYGANKSSAGNDIHRLIDSKVDQQLKYVQGLISHSDERYKAALAKTHKKSIDAHARILNLWASYKNLFENKPVGFFDPKYFFPGVKEGFDIVIANPPYVDSETMTREQPETREIYSKIYTTAKGNWDLYIPFLELGYNLLSNGGIACYITPNKWYAIGYGKEIRSKLQYKVFRVGNCNSVKVFEAGNSPVVTLFKNGVIYDQMTVDKFSDDYRILTKTTINNSILSDHFGVIFSENLTLTSKIKSLPRRISDYYSALNPCSVSEAYEIKKIIKNLDEDLDLQKYFLFANTGTIDPFTSLWGRKDTTYLKSKYAKPVIERDEFEEALPRRYSQMCKQKIIVSGMRHFESFLDNDGVYVAGKSTEIILKKTNLDLRIALAIFNSKLVQYYIKQNYNVLGIDGGINFTTELIENIPVPELRNDEIVINHVDKILAEKSNNPTADVLSLEHQIDTLIYQLYGLTNEEIQIIEEAASR